MSSKILPLATPAVNTFNQYASLFSLISGDENAWPWIYSNFINLQYYEEKNNGSIKVLFFDKYHQSFELCPFLTTYSLPRFLMQSNFRTFTEFIVFSVNNDFCVYTYIDQYYLPQSKHFKKKKKWHEIFIYGYDELTREAYICDNLDDGKYIQTTCNFEDLERAINAINMREPFYSNIYMIRKDGGWFEFKIEEVIFSLENYLNSRGASGSFQGPLKLTYGLDCKRLMISLVKQAIIDKRSFHLLWEHKNLMLKRIKYLFENGYLKQNKYINEYQVVLNNAIFAKTLALKYLKKNDPSTLGMICSKLEQMMNKEEAILSNLLDDLK